MYKLFESKAYDYDLYDAILDISLQFVVINVVYSVFSPNLHVILVFFLWFGVIVRLMVYAPLIFIWNNHFLHPQIGTYV